jgi:hypothetical protein
MERLAREDNGKRKLQSNQKQKSDYQSKGKEHSHQ